MTQVVSYNPAVIPPYSLVSIIDDGHGGLSRVWDTHPTPPSIDPAQKLAEWAEEVAICLKAAMCGDSQVTEQSVSMAVVGHLQNGGVGCYGTIKEICSALCVQFGQDNLPPLDSEAVEKLVREVVVTDPRYGQDAYPLPGYY